MAGQRAAERHTRPWSLLLLSPDQRHLSSSFSSAKLHVALGGSVELYDNQVSVKQRAARQPEHKEIKWPTYKSTRHPQQQRRQVGWQRLEPRPQIDPAHPRLQHLAHRSNPKSLFDASGIGIDQAADWGHTGNKHCQLVKQHHCQANLREPCQCGRVRAQQQRANTQKQQTKGKNWQSEKEDVDQNREKADQITQRPLAPRRQRRWKAFASIFQALHLEPE